jgi:hypothetical protein
MIKLIIEIAPSLKTTDGDHVSVKSWAEVKGVPTLMMGSTAAHIHKAIESATEEALGNVNLTNVLLRNIRDGKTDKEILEIIKPMMVEGSTGEAALAFVREQEAAGAFTPETTVTEPIDTKGMPTC